MTGNPRRIPLPTPERVRCIVRYDGERFFWLPRPVGEFKNVVAWGIWSRRFANQPVAIKHQPNGYHGVRIDRALIMIHRLIWVLHYGAWPLGEIDHIDGDKTNNAIMNLRDVTKSGNMRNQHVRSDSTSGFPGVHFCKDKGSRPWAAKIGIRGRWKHLGYFATREEAIECRRREQVKYGFTERHGSARANADAITWFQGSRDPQQPTAPHGGSLDPQ